MWGACTIAASAPSMFSALLGWAPPGASPPSHPSKNVNHSNAHIRLDSTPTNASSTSPAVLAQYPPSLPRIRQTIATRFGPCRHACQSPGFPSKRGPVVARRTHGTKPTSHADQRHGNFIHSTFLERHVFAGQISFANKFQSLFNISTRQGKNNTGSKGCTCGVWFCTILAGQTRT